MFRRIYPIFFVLLLILISLSGCAENEIGHSDEPSTATSSAESSAASSETSKSTSGIPEPSSAAESTTPQVQIPEETFPPTSDVNPNVSEPSPKPPITKPSETKPLPEETKPVPAKHISSLGCSLQEYQSAGEPTPYVKGMPIYKLLYSGSRAQIGDTLIYKLTVTPADHKDSLQIDASDNLSCTLSGTTLSVKINSAGKYDIGQITVYGLSEDGRTVTASCDISLTIDKGGNPFDNLPDILSAYIRHTGLQYTTVAHGYTEANPALSITQYPNAPSWDDQIQKAHPDWLKKCFWLIDEYAKRGFSKVNFIVTDTSIGFCASK